MTLSHKVIVFQGLVRFFTGLALRQLVQTARTLHRLCALMKSGASGFSWTRGIFQSFPRQDNRDKYVAP